MEVYGKAITGLGPKEEKRPVLFNTLAPIHVTCNMFLMHCFGFGESYNDFSFEKSTFFKTKIIKTAEKT